MTTPEPHPVPHDVDWDLDKVGRFWDYMSKRAAGDYYSEQVGDDLIRYARRKLGRIEGRVLDFGCGPGHLMEKLAGRGIRCEGVDFSPHSIATTEEKLRGHASFAGVRRIHAVPTDLPADTYDVVFFVETIEHVLKDALASTTAELFRIVRPGGHIVVTTPHDEQLDDRKVMCPDCGCVFHRVQHVSTFTVPSLSGLMGDAGFETTSARATLLTRRNLLWKLGVRAKVAVQRRPPHLVYVGQKPVAATARRRAAA